MEFPYTIYLRQKGGAWMTAHVILGETPRSWITGSSWSPTKIAKSKHEVVSREDFERWDWVVRNWQHIRNKVRGDLAYESLRKIAELVGYEEKEK